MSGNIRVVCRFRPQNSKEIKANGKVVVDFLDDQTVHLNGNETDHKFTFDKIFLPTNSQKEVYELTALPVVKDIFQGYNGTIFVYGQTSSGKTHTMMGPDGGKGMEDPAMKGIIPRMVSTIFEQVESADENLEFIVSVSYIEIYMEKIRDLLNPANDNLPVRENKARGIYVEGSTEVCVASEEEVMDVMRMGQSNRSVGFTKMNAESSRSHSLFVVNVTQNDIRTGSKRNGKLYLVDLAGSEKVGKTGAKGTTLDEAKMINKSLSALGNVINALTDGKSKHIPYRDSKLTRVLQESIGGNSRTTLIVNCSPDSSNELETLSTLRFGTRAKSIKNKATVNEERSVGEMKIICRKLQQEIQRLRKYITTLEGELGIVKGGGTSSLVDSMNQEAASASAPSVVQPTGGSVLKELHEQIEQLESQVAKKDESLNVAEEAKNILMDQLTEKQTDYEQLQAELNVAEATLQEREKELQELQEEQQNLIAQVANKDIEIDKLQKSTVLQVSQLEEVKQETRRLKEENIVLTAQLQNEDQQRKRKRSVSLQKINRERENWTHKEEIIEENLSRSLQKIISPELSLSSEDTSSLTQAISDTRDHLAEFREFQNALLADWKQRSKVLLQLQEYIEDAIVDFDKLQMCNTFSLQEKNLILSKQLQQLQETHCEQVAEKERAVIGLAVAEEKLLLRDKRIQDLEDQLRTEKELREAQDKQYATQFEEFARQIEAQKKRQQASFAHGGVKTLRGGGGKKKPQPEPKKTSWFGSLFSPSPKKPSKEGKEAAPLEMSITNAFDME